jgi:hypothetical protein
VKKKYIAIIAILLIIIGILIFKIIISSDNNTPGKLIEDDINKFQKNQEDELKSVKEEDFLGWWNGTLSAKIEKNRITYYSSTIYFEKVSDNEIIYSSTTYTNKDGTGLFGTFANEDLNDCYIKISNKENNLFVEIEQGGAIDKYEYEKIGYVDYQDGKRYLYFLSPHEDYVIDDVNFKDGKMYKGNEVVMEKINGVVKIENREYQRMNILDE